jgi:hypothetical protein
MTEICGISSGSLTFGCRVKLSHFLAWRAGTSSRYSTGEGSPIKAGQPEPSLHLETACENHHIYEDLNKSSSARPGRSQQLEIPPSLNSKQAACFSSPTGFFTRRGDFNARKDSIVRLIFCKRKDFTNPPDFLYTQGFHKSA